MTFNLDLSFYDRQTEIKSRYTNFLLMSRTGSGLLCMVTPFDAWRKKTAPLTQGEQATFILSKRVPPERDERIEGSAHVIDLVRIKIAHYPRRPFLASLPNKC